MIPFGNKNEQIPLPTVQKNEECNGMFGDYKLVFADGTEITLEQVAISSRGDRTRTTFLNKEYRTCFVAPDNAIKYIQEI